MGPSLHYERALREIFVKLNGENSQQVFLSQLKLLIEKAFVQVTSIICLTSKQEDCIGTMSHCGGKGPRI